MQIIHTTNTAYLGHLTPADKARKLSKPHYPGAKKAKKKPKNIKCEYCKAGFSSKDELSSHLQSVPKEHLKLRDSIRIKFINEILKSFPCSLQIPLCYFLKDGKTLQEHNMVCIDMTDINYTISFFRDKLNIKMSLDSSKKNLLLEKTGAQS